MDDRFLHEARRAPRADFTAALRQRLAREDEKHHARSFGRSRALRRVLTAALPVAVAILALVLFPEVRAGAQAFLELFRVRNFAAVNVDERRLDALKLKMNGMDPLRMVGEPISNTPPEPPRFFDDPASAFASAGLVRREPSYLPNGIQPDTAVVIGARQAELRVEARKLNELLSSLGIHDATLPPALDGATIGVRTQRAVAIRYDDGQGVHRARLVQSPHPEISLPPGLERARLAEIGLRIVGLDAQEARRFAERIDWNSTILIPVPTGECTFREVEVKGRKALLIEASPPDGDMRPRVHSENSPRDGRLLMWSDDERIYALAGNVPDRAMLLMAESLP